MCIFMQRENQADVSRHTLDDFCTILRVNTESGNVKSLQLEKVPIGSMLAQYRFTHYKQVHNYCAPRHFTLCSKKGLDRNDPKGRNTLRLKASCIYQTIQPIKSTHMKHTTRNLLQLFLYTISASVLSTGVCAQNAEYDYKQTGLPVCFVDFDPSITITKEEKTKAVITLCTTSDTLKSDVNISGRGNNTWLLPKKPYNLKFEKKTSLLGMREGKKYALMANQCDPSMMRIAVGFEAGRWVGFEWPLEGRYVELVINGKHQGCYFLAERVSNTTVGIDKNFGYILEYKYPDQVTDESVNFVTNKEGYIMEFKSPDDPEVDGEMYNNAKETINRFEDEVFDGEKFEERRWAERIDMDNFVRWYYWKNLLQMNECNRYYVVENYKQGTLLKMGPLWDFDWSIGAKGIDGTVEHYTYHTPINKLYFMQIAQDSTFLEKVAELHFQLRNDIERKANELYDSLSTLLRPSEELNEKIWGAGPYWQSIPNWNEEVETDRTYLLSTLTFLDQTLIPYASDGIASPTSSALPPYPTKFLHNGQVYIRRGKDIFDCQGRKAYWTERGN